MVGVELEDFIAYVPLNLTDGTFSGHRFFECQNGKALFIEAECCHKDNRFSDDFVVESKVFGHTESPVVTENIPPISKLKINIKFFLAKFDVKCRFRFEESSRIGRNNWRK